MKQIKEHQRKVANIFQESAYTPYQDDKGNDLGTSYIQLNSDKPRDVGFYIYRMSPGSHSTPHQHGGCEEFVVVQGDLMDNDGTEYGPGDVVWLAPGTEHTSTTTNGCIVAVYSEGLEFKPGTDGKPLPIS